MVKYPWSLDGKQPPPPNAIHTHHKTWTFFERHLPNFSIGAMVFMLIAAVLYPHMVVTVPSGHVGVLWKRFSGPGVYCMCMLRRGTILDPQELRDEGLHVIWPWDKLYIYDLRLQSATQTYDAISSEGVRLTATLNVRFQLKHNAAALVHKFIGPGYIGSIVNPEISSRTREIIARHTAEEVYSFLRPDIEAQIRESAKKQLADHLENLVQPESSEQMMHSSKAGYDAQLQSYKDQIKGAVEFIDTLILSIKLPPPVVGAINRKTEQYYLVQEYQFRVERERKESERKQIEATGIAAFQKTIGDGISDSYLRWRGIEATLELAKSNNSKIVIIGSGKDGLPIILGNVDAPAPPAPNKDAPPPAPPNKDAPTKDAPKPPTTGDKPTPPTETPPNGTPPNTTPTPAPDKPTTGTPPPSPPPNPDKPTTGNKPVKNSKAPGNDKSLYSVNFSDVGAFLSRFSDVFGSKGQGTTGTAPK